MHCQRTFMTESKLLLRHASNSSLVLLPEPASSTCNKGDQLVNNKASGRGVGVLAVVPGVKKAVQLLKAGA